MAKTARNVVIRTESTAEGVGVVRKVEIDGEAFPYYTRGDVRVEVAKSGSQVVWLPLFVDPDGDDVRIDTHSAVNA